MHALLVDKYMLHKVVEPLKETWAREVEEFVPKVHHGESTLHWMTIAYRLRMEEVFERTTGWLLRFGPMKAKTAELPIPHVLGESGHFFVLVFASLKLFFCFNSIDRRILFFLFGY